MNFKSLVNIIHFLLICLPYVKRWALLNVEGRVESLIINYMGVDSGYCFGASASKQLPEFFPSVNRSSYWN